MRRALMTPAVAVAVAVMVGAACMPPNPGPSGLYLGVQPDITPVVTPKGSPVTWGAAPVIDEHYGGTLYEGTSIETPDPRPPLLAGGLQPLRMWVADPDNGVTNRPAIIWIHGGGFAVGIDSMYSLAAGVGQEYAKRGYVSFSLEYRIDTTMGEGTGPRPPSLCQWVQDNVDPTSDVWLARRLQCFRNVVAAQRDAAAAVRWVRAHAAEYGVDPARIAVAGFSAGAVTAAELAYRWEDVGDVSYFAGDDRSAAGSRPDAVIGASGCAYPIELGATVPSYIGAGDVPASFIASELDQALPYGCAATTATTARAAGLVAELTSYCDQAGHAQKLYEAHRAETDVQWTTFLARELHLYSGMRPPSTDPICT